MKIKVIRTTSRDSSVTVEDELFDKDNDWLLAQAVRVYLSNQRQGTSKTQTRSEVTRTTRKWYAQKGTGNARHGSRDPTLFVGGAVAHGPTGRENWKKSLSQQQKKLALAAAFSAQAKNVVINDELLELSGKTKQAYQLLTEIINKFKPDQNDFEQQGVLIVVSEKNDKLYRAVNNLANVEVKLSSLLNALDVAQADIIVLTSQSLQDLQDKVAA